MTQTFAGRYSNSRARTAYDVHISHTVEDEEWDRFLSTAQDGELLQCSLWATLKATTGWRVARIVIKQDNRILGGAQILLRPLPFLLGSIGYLPRGPVLANDAPELAQLVVEQIKRVARRQRIQCLFLQAPPTRPELTHRLLEAGFQETSTKTRIAPESTLRLDLAPTKDELLAAMRRGTRANIRRSARAGITVRNGTQADLDVFSRLHEASSDRQGFDTASEAYYRDMWRIFSPSGRIQLFIAHHDEEDISAMLILCFGESVWAKRLGWSGKYRKDGPNEALLWGAKQWAKANGYRYFDSDGISMTAAQALVNDKPLPDSVRRTPTYFKLGFGGEASILPGAQAYIYNPLLRYAYTSLFPKLDQWSITKKIITWLRLA